MASWTVEVSKSTFSNHLRNQLISKREKKTDKNRVFKRVGVTEEDALCGNGKTFVHNSNTCQGHVAPGFPQKL